jgi:transcriptional regulator of acetoin/glycerol metabolism
VRIVVVCGDRSGEPDVAAAVRARCEERGVAVDVVAPAGLPQVLSGPQPPVHVVVDRRTLDDAETAALRATRSLLDDCDVLVSMVYGELELGELADIFLWPSLDLVLPLRDASDVPPFVETVLDHAQRHRTDRPEGAYEIGSIYRVSDTGYAQARQLSLVSNGMRSFIDELRSAVAVLGRYPLAQQVPWDPKDGQPDSLAVQDKTGRWRLQLHGREVPNLTQVLNAHATEEGRLRLSGEWVRRRTEAWAPTWQQAWADHAKPPPVLLTGESGTGKSLAAETIADLLRTHQRPHQGRFMKINCGALTESTLVHTLMGSAPRTWTGVEEAAVGELVRAAHGVVFFDEIGDLSPDVQRALLTYLDDRRLRPTGMSRFPAFQHVLAATNRDVTEGANQQWFRNDLLARFTIRLTIPPLRERGGDELRQLLDFVAQEPTVNPRSRGRLLVQWIDGEAYRDLVSRNYRDGNFRELQEVVHSALRAAAFRRSSVVEPVDVPAISSPHARSDRDSRRIRVRSMTPPSGLPLIDVQDEQDLRVLAHLESRVMLVDDSGTSWVLSPAAVFRAPTEH